MGHPDVELICTKFCRKILVRNVKQSTNRDAPYGELGRVPMYIHRKNDVEILDKDIKSTQKYSLT